MILSDRDLKAEIESGRLVIDPLGKNAIQPSSIDLHVGRQFRVFANTRYPYIDVRKPMEDLTELVEAINDEPFILHPGEFVLGTTLEKVEIPDDLVARLDGKSSLGRLGLLIHSSLPASEEILFLDDEGTLAWTPIGDVVRKSLTGAVVAFDPETFEVGYHRLTGWYEGPPDVIFEVRLASGRRVRVTAGHNFFTIDRHGDLTKIRTGELQTSTLVAIPRQIPDPAIGTPILDVLSVISEADWPDLVAHGDVVGTFHEQQQKLATRMLGELGIAHAAYYRKRNQLPLAIVAQVPELMAAVRASARIGVKGAKASLPARILIGEDIAWLLGLYLAEGSRRRNQVAFSNTDQAILDRVETILRTLGQPTSRSSGVVVACSGVFSLVVKNLGFGAGARSKRIPEAVMGWPRPLLESFFQGFEDGDGSQDVGRVSLWTSSESLAGDLMSLGVRLGRRSAAYLRIRLGRDHYQVAFPHREHKLLSSVPLPDLLLVDVRRSLNWTQKLAAQQIGFKHPTDLCNIEKRLGRDAIRRTTVARLVGGYAACPDRAALNRLQRLATGHLAWDRVTEVVRLPPEPIFDVSVRPGGAMIENFLAGRGGVFVANTAGFVDPGFRGHLTLEFSNVANLPITLYPGMKIGQISLFRMSSPAENAYGTGPLGSKYLDQEGPTPSRYWENFEKDSDSSDSSDS
ncbi:hypothetical protein BH18ACT5_BH18ACT5_15930 [soil metagenome]